jgi:Fe-S-cluster-containing dehydrogenase component
MNPTRRHFLVAGLSVLGAGWSLGPIASTLGRQPRTQASPTRVKRWCMVVDISRCRRQEGCQACIHQCHTAHNVPNVALARHRVHWITKLPYERAFPDGSNEPAPETLRGTPVVTLCNHCQRPPCVRVCPTQATWKRPADGIVLVDMHRCVGCRYCLAACPYGARNFHFVDPTPYISQLNPNFPTATKGVVDKCNFCVERLTKGRLPACVEACRQLGSGALVFGDLNDPTSEVSDILRSKYALRRKPELGTGPNVYYLV